MSYLYFCITFLFCCVCVSCTFLFCLKAFYLYKVEKINPVYAVKSEKEVKKVSAKKRLEHDELMEKLLENG